MSLDKLQLSQQKLEEILEKYGPKVNDARMNDASCLSLKEQGRKHSISRSQYKIITYIPIDGPTDRRTSAPIESLRSD